MLALAIRPLEQDSKILDNGSQVQTRPQAIPVPRNGRARSDRGTDVEQQVRGQRRFVSGRRRAPVVPGLACPPSSSEHLGYSRTRLAGVRPSSALEARPQPITVTSGQLPGLRLTVTSPSASSHLKAR